MIEQDWKPLLDRALAHAVEHLRALPERPVRPRHDSAALLAEIDRPVPDHPTPPIEVLDELVRIAEPGLTAMPAGRFFGWVIGGAVPAALAADWLTSVWDQNAGSAEGTPAAAAVEQVAIRWVLELLDLPRQASAALVTGAQMANFVCLAAARDRVLQAVGWDVESHGLAGAPRVRVVVGAERHDTLDRALRFLGFGTASVVVEVDAEGRMRPAALGRELAASELPTIVCMQVGNVNGGAIDPVEEIVDAVERLRRRLPRGAVWLHVDGAFGLWARASRALGPLVAGVERADSWATDAHKWLNTPYDCGLAIVADPQAHRRAIGIHADYLPAQDDPGVRVPFDWTPELSRRARGFALWAALRQLGRSGIEELVDRTCRLARSFAERLARADGVEVLHPVRLNQLVVRFHDPAGQDDDAHTREVVRRTQRDGTCFPTPTVWRGVAAMRISVSNWSTDDADVERSVAAILRAHRFR